MSDINKVIIGGRLTADPTVRNGGSVAVLSVASNRQWPDASAPGGWKGATTFADVSVFSHLAKRCIEKLVKGDAVVIEGRLDDNSYVNAENVKVKTTSRVTASAVESPAFHPTRYTRAFDTDAAPLPVEANVPAADPVSEPVGVQVVAGATNDGIPF